MLGLYQAANKIGFTAEGCEAGMAALINHMEPLILHVTIDNTLQHYLVCYGTVTYNSEIKFIIGDPGKGITYIGRNDLEKIWLTKSCITLAPNDTFIKEKVLNNRKWQWIKQLLIEDFSILGVAAGIGIAIAILGLVMALFSQRLIDDILPKKDLIKLNLGVVLLIILLLLKESFTFLRQYFLLRQSKDFNTRIINFFTRIYYNYLSLFLIQEKLAI